MAGATFVLVPGAWHGGRCWKRVATLLRAKGHHVYTPTLTGLADRAHLLSPSIGLDTHLEDIVQLIRWEELSEVVLVGHSYAGIVISGVVEETESAIGSLIFLDAFVPENGQSLIDIFAGGQRILKAAQEGATLSRRSRHRCST